MRQEADVEAVSALQWEALRSFYVLPTYMKVSSTTVFPAKLKMFNSIFFSSVLFYLLLIKAGSCIAHFQIQRHTNTYLLAYECIWTINIIEKHILCVCKATSISEAIRYSIWYVFYIVGENKTFLCLYTWPLLLLIEPMKHHDTGQQKAVTEDPQYAP